MSIVIVDNRKIFKFTRVIRRKRISIELAPKSRYSALQCIHCGFVAFRRTSIVSDVSVRYYSAFACARRVFSTVFS